MAIEFTCKNCNAILRVPDEHAGKKAKCPKCETLNVIQAGTIEPQAPQKPMADSADFGNPFATPTGMPSGGFTGRAHQAPHRGSTVLSLGIAALVCNFALIPGILAWVFGRSDMREINAGRMDPEGRGMTQAGMILGIIGTLIPLVIFMIYVIFIIIVVVIAALGAAGGGGF